MISNVPHLPGQFKSPALLRPCPKRTVVHSTIPAVALRWYSALGSCECPTFPNGGRLCPPTEMAKNATIIGEKSEISRALLQCSDLNDVDLRQPLGYSKYQICAVIGSGLSPNCGENQRHAPQNGRPPTWKSAKPGIAHFSRSPWIPYLEKGRSPLRAWEKWLHAAFFDHVYYLK